MFLIKYLLPKEWGEVVFFFFFAGGGGNDTLDKRISFTVTNSVDWRMNKISKQLDTEWTVETLMSDKALGNLLFFSFILCKIWIVTPILSITLDSNFCEVPTLYLGCHRHAKIVVSPSSSSSSTKRLQFLLT